MIVDISSTVAENAECSCDGRRIRSMRETMGEKLTDDGRCYAPILPASSISVTRPVPALSGTNVFTSSANFCVGLSIVSFDKQFAEQSSASRIMLSHTC